MALPFAGRLFQNNSVWTQTINQIKLVNLKAAKRVTVQFDPFHRKAANTRLVSHIICFIHTLYKLLPLLLFILFSFDFVLFIFDC